MIDEAGCEKIGEKLKYVYSVILWQWKKVVTSYGRDLLEKMHVGEAMAFSAQSIGNLELAYRCWWQAKDSQTRSQIVSTSEGTQNC